MNADLVGPPRLKPAFDQRSAVKAFQQLVMGDRVLAALVELVQHRHLLAVVGRAAQAGDDRALGGAGGAADQGDIDPVDVVGVDLTNGA